METMIGPLWGFFKFIKDKFSMPLAIDQYFYLVEVLHKMPLYSATDDPDESKSILENRESLLSFTKIFWLNDLNFEAEYNRYFELFFDKETLLETISKPGETKKEKHSVSNGTNTSPTTKDLPQKSGNEKESKSNTKLKDPWETEGMVDFELVLQDAKGSRPEGKDTLKKSEHTFMLADKAIMPFETRHFAQRLRRKVETTEKVISSRINIPEMVKEYTQQGFVNDILYEYDDSSFSNVVLLADRYGSMLAYEFLEENFRESLQQIPHCNFEHYSFYNLPQLDRGEYSFRSMDDAVKGNTLQPKKWNDKTWFFVLSDAGGHSGMVNKERMQATLKFWKYLNHISEYVYWVNPIPFEFLNDCSAKRLQMVIPMIHPDDISLHKTINEAKPIA